MAFRAVVLDLGGVIFPSPLVSLAPLRHLNWESLSPSLKALEEGLIDRGEFMRGTHPNGQKVLEAIEKQVAQPNLTMIDVVDSIRARGIKVGFITSDWQSCFNEKILDEKIKPRADTFIRSHKVNLRKANPQIFKLALDELGIPANECIFMDDIGQNLRTAQQVGMRTIMCYTKTRDEVDDAALKELEGLLGFEVCPTESLSSGHRHAIQTTSVEDYLKQNAILSTEEHISTYRKFKQGQSNPTYVLTCSNVTNSKHAERRIVLRKKPSGVTIASAHRVDREFKLFSALGKHTKVPVPKTLAMCINNDSVVGSDCYFMEMVESRNIIDPNLPFFSASDATSMYRSLCNTIVQLHQVDYKAIGLGEFGKPENFFERQLDRWGSQFRAEVADDPHKIPEMLELEAFLRKEMVTIPKVPGTIIHGDYRVDNVLFHPHKPEVISILDVELSTIGHPFSDVALLPVYHDIIRAGFLGPKPKGPRNSGIPSDVDFVNQYFSEMYKSKSIEALTIPNWNVLTAFCYWRVAAIFHGVYSRSISGNASSPRAITFGSAVPVLARKGLEIANSAAFKISTNQL